MSIPTFGLLLVIAGVVLWIWLAGSRRFQRIERQASMYRHPAGNDHELTIFEKLPLYDHVERGDF